MADLNYTTIEESARKQLGISRDEYAACNYIQTWSAYPSSKTPGLCNRTRGQMADFIGITERGLQKMLLKLDGAGLIVRASKSQFLYRITAVWFDAVMTAKNERSREQSSPQAGNKVPAIREQSSPQAGNKVHPHKEFNKEVVGSVDNTTPAPEFQTLKAEFPQSPKVAPKGSFPTSPAQFPAATPEAWQDMGGVIKVVDPEFPGVVIVDGAGPIEPPKELRYSDYPMPADAIELKEALSTYFEQRPQEWQKLIETAQVRWAKEKVADTVIEFCLHQQKESNLKRTFREYQAALTIWFRRQKSFDSQRTQNNNATTTAQKSTLNRLGSDKSLYDEPALF